MLTKVRTILFTEACPLQCRYCYLRQHSGYGTQPPLPREMILEQIAKYDKEDDPTKMNTRLLLTGGEPFLYPELIYEIINLYGTRFQYSFNTSGYCFTEEMLEFLSHYHVTFVLSVDGGERLTNYLRPLKSNPYGVGYFKQFKKMIPTLLYYFPKTPFRIIINPRYVDLIYNQYLEAEQLGFKYFTFVLDFETRPGKPVEGVKPWDSKDTEILREQFHLIVEQILLGFKNNINRTQIVDVNQVIQFLLNNETYSPDKLPCQVFAGRSMLSVQGRKDGAYCMGKQFPDPEDAKQALLDAYVKTGGECSINKNCPAFDYCAHKCCPKNSIDIHGEFFKFEELECAANDVSYYSALLLLTLANEECPESTVYKKFLSQFKLPTQREIEGEEYGG